MKSVHQSVLFHEVVNGLSLEKDDVVLDGTLGAFGHGTAICEKLGSCGVYIGLDEDEDAVERAKRLLTKTKARVVFKQGNFRKLDEILNELGIEKIDKVLFDLGISSDELEHSGRGFSFKRDEPLLMTFKVHPDPEKDLTARTIVNHFDGDALYTIIRNYGEERFAKRIVAGILSTREKKSIETTGELVRIIEEHIPSYPRRRTIHPATKTFQALRMAVNDEFQTLVEGLRKATHQLSPGGRIAVIAFESVTDRAVKNFFKELARNDTFEIHTKKPITPSDTEKLENPRSRSAKLRIAEKKKIAQK